MHMRIKEEGGSEGEMCWRIRGLAHGKKHIIIYIHIIIQPDTVLLYLPSLRAGERHF